MKYQRCMSSAAICASLFLLAACGQSEGGKAKGKKTVLATTGMIADLARRVGGDTIEVLELMGPGVDPHEYQPTTSDSSKLASADLILYNGLHLEGKMFNILENHSRAKAVSSGIPSDLLISEEGQPDPHIWFDVALWIHALGAVEKELQTLEPAHAEQYGQNAEKYRQELNDLHAEVKGQLAAIPQAQRVFVTAHDAFHYLGRAYGMEVVGLQGISTSNQAGEKKIQEVVDSIIQRKIKAVFSETSVADDGINAVMERCKARGYDLKKAEGSLFSDAMGESGKPEGTYPGMVRHNIRIIVNALK